MESGKASFPALPSLRSQTLSKRPNQTSEATLHELSPSPLSKPRIHPTPPHHRTSYRRFRSRKKEKSLSPPSLSTCPFACLFRVLRMHTTNNMKHSHTHTSSNQQPSTLKPPPPSAPLQKNKTKQNQTNCKPTQLNSTQLDARIYIYIGRERERESQYNHHSPYLDQHISMNTHTTQK